jgi:hypothetical protein
VLRGVRGSTDLIMVRSIRLEGGLEDLFDNFIGLLRTLGGQITPLLIAQCR